MQDIDFSRYYRRQRPPYAGKGPAENKPTGTPVNKVSLYLAIAFSSLAIGFIGGLYPALRAARMPVTTALRES